MRAGRAPCRTPAQTDRTLPRRLTAAATGVRIVRAARSGPTLPVHEFVGRGRPRVRRSTVGPGRDGDCGISDRVPAPSEALSVSYPIQPGKVQAPALRDETLARDEASRLARGQDPQPRGLRHRGRRLRQDDAPRRLLYDGRGCGRSGIGSTRRIATGPGSCPISSPPAESTIRSSRHGPPAMLQDTGPGGATRDEAVAMFLRELPDIAPTPTVLILDDYHVADGSGDVAYVAKSLITRAPERLTIVISSRRTPEVAVGRLRAQGELAELRTRDLQFSESEIADLFESKDGRHLDPESLDLLNRRSEGWAASLQLVHAAVRDRTSAEARDFIRGLSGGQDELYDYLAEEVVGDLLPGHQEFLMRTSILQVITAQGAAVLAELTSPESASLLELSERLGLISRRSSASGAYRYHPLVREFLEARLKASVGEAGVRALHEAAGDWARDSDWRAACHHFEAASNIGALHEVIDTSIDTISGQAGYETAADYLRRHRPAVTTASFEIISSRMDHRNGRTEFGCSPGPPSVGAATGFGCSNQQCDHDVRQCWRPRCELGARQALGRIVHI